MTDVANPADAWMQTWSGRRVHALNPDPATINITDIAVQLSRQNRFTGATDQPYSVAQHSVLLSRLVPRPYALEALLHDASEAYLADVARPFKILKMYDEYRKYERQLTGVIFHKYNVPCIVEDQFAEYGTLHEVVDEMDKRLCLTEAHELMTGKTDDWEIPYKGRAVKPISNYVIWPWHERVAVARFLARFMEVS